MTSVTADTTGVLYNISRACIIYCEGSLLETIQLSQIYNDSKTFVDMPMIYEPEEVLDNYNSISDKSNVTLLKIFLEENFLEAGSDLDNWIPTDYNPIPDLYSDIPDNYPFKKWFLDLNNLWLLLGRNISDSVVQHPEKHSYLPRSYPMVVPGGRFRESYYWDSYWIVRGLLICNMNETSYYIIQNLLTDVKNFGFVPNGGRIYYLDRSQPPLLSEMVLKYYNYMVLRNDYQLNKEFVNNFLLNAYELLITEYQFWMNASHGHVVTLNNPSDSSQVFHLNQYFSNYSSPRPESFFEDYVNSEQSIRTREEVNFFYRSTRAGAETGWDFSSRWILEYYNISNIDTINIIPVELNTFMFQFELNLAKLTVLVNGINEVVDPETVDYYLRAATERYQAIQIFLWDNASFHWRDFNVSSLSFVASFRQNYSTIAYWIPMWAGIIPNDANYDERLKNEVLQGYEKQSTAYNVADQLVNSLLNSGLIQVGGVLTSNINTGQQWDAPNAWPPLVSLTIEGLKRIDTPSSLSLARSLTFLWLNTCYLAFNSSGFMYEKYDAYVVGKGGGGGEYTPQKGFGWSNGVALILINETYKAYIHSAQSSSSSQIDNLSIVIAVLISVLALCLLTFIVLYYNPKYSHRIQAVVCRDSSQPTENVAELRAPLIKAEVLNPVV